MEAVAYQSRARVTSEVPLRAMAPAGVVMELEDCNTSKGLVSPRSHEVQLVPTGVATQTITVAVLLIVSNPSIQIKMEQVRQVLVPTISKGLHRTNIIPHRKIQMLVVDPVA